MSPLRCSLAVLCFVSLGFAEEKLDRGVAAFPTKDGAVNVGWRLLADDGKDIGFDVYRADSPSAVARKLNPTPITGSTNFVDRTPAGAAAKPTSSSTRKGMVMGGPEFLVKLDGATGRRPCLMEDRQYRTSVARVTMG